jgi:integrase
MSIPALNKVFSELRKSSQNLPKNFSPHIMRHSWNDNFSKIMDAKNIPEEREKQIRSYLMGWSPTSDSASTYTKRHVEKKANEVLLEMSNYSVKREKES